MNWPKKLTVSDEIVLELWYDGSFSIVKTCLGKSFRLPFSSWEIDLIKEALDKNEQVL